MSTLTFDLLVAGGGAAGMMAAITAAEQGLSVLILEKNDRPCRKVYITGKGRCNVTNLCSWKEVLENIPTGSKFLYGAMQAFDPEAVMAFFEDLGCPLKVERGNRVFPVTDKSASVIDALRQRSRELGISLKQATVTDIIVKDGKAAGLKTSIGDFFAPQVLLAVGGASYPRTGSTGDGYRIAQAVGHTIVPPTGALVPLVEDGDFCRKLSGLSLRNVAVKLVNSKKKTVYSDFGEAEFAEFGLTGPTILSCSCHMGRDSGFEIVIDLKPALSQEKLEARLLRDLQKYQNCPMETALIELLPKQMIVPILEKAGILPSLAANSLKKGQRQELLRVIKICSIPIRGKRPLEEAIVTSGGVKTSETDPKTMQSKKLPGLYFAGELLDIDAYTGGFNLQIAWATGRAAGLAAAKNHLERYNHE